MYIIGITGGIGAGKSTVLDLLRKNFNSYIIMADDISREIMEPGKTGFQKVIEVFGETILQENGHIDRKMLASMVFENKNKLMVLNSIIHPLVKKEIIEEVGRLKCEEKYDYIFIEAALLIEDHYNIICDELWFISASDEVRAKRLRESRGYDDKRIADTIANQLSPDEYRKHCKVEIKNDSSLEDTLKQLKIQLKKIQNQNKCRE